MYPYTSENQIPWYHTREGRYFKVFNRWCLWTIEPYNDVGVLIILFLYFKKFNFRFWRKCFRFDIVSLNNNKNSWVVCNRWKSYLPWDTLVLCITNIICSYIFRLRILLEYVTWLELILKMSMKAKKSFLTVKKSRPKPIFFIIRKYCLKLE